MIVMIVFLFEARLDELDDRHIRQWSIRLLAVGANRNSADHKNAEFPS